MPFLQGWVTINFKPIASIFLQIIVNNKKLYLYIHNITMDDQYGHDTCIHFLTINLENYVLVYCLKKLSS